MPSVEYVDTVPGVADRCLSRGVGVRVQVLMYCTSTRGIVVERICVEEFSRV